MMGSKSIFEQYRWFIDYYTDKFSFLTDVYKYRFIGADVHGYELNIIYRFGNSRGVVLQYEYPGVPIIFLGGDYDVDGKNKSVKIYIDEFINKECEDRTLASVLIGHEAEMTGTNRGELSKNEVLRAIDLYSELLMKYGDDVLSGNWHKYLRGPGSDQAK